MTNKAGGCLIFMKYTAKRKKNYGHTIQVIT
jgi:hypothetical protein